MRRLRRPASASRLCTRFRHSLERVRSGHFLKNGASLLCGGSSPDFSLHGRRAVRPRRLASSEADPLDRCACGPFRRPASRNDETRADCPERPQTAAPWVKPDGLVSVFVVPSPGRGPHAAAPPLRAGVRRSVCPSSCNRRVAGFRMPADTVHRLAWARSRRHHDVGAFAASVPHPAPRPRPTQRNRTGAARVGLGDPVSPIRSLQPGPCNPVSAIRDGGTQPERSTDRPSRTPSSGTTAQWLAF
jgi:hypothetical protein